jgi:hypothetical protein
MNAIGSLLKGAGMVVWFVAGLWGFFLCLGIISHAAGFWGIVGGLFLAPITFVAAPLYAGFEHGDWFPLILNYGGSVVAMVLMGIGGAMSNDQ